MRYYREEGLSAKWDHSSERVFAVLPTLSPDHAAQFHYERALFALFALNIEQLKSRLAEWPHNDALPFWAAKKAGLLAEIGQVSEAERILEQSLDTIRTKLNLTPTKADYTLARIMREGVDSGRDTRASVWYKRSVYKRLATTEAPA